MQITNASKTSLWNCTWICAECLVQGLHILWKSLLPNPPKRCKSNFQSTAWEILYKYGREAFSYKHLQPAPVQAVSPVAATSMFQLPEDAGECWAFKGVSLSGAKIMSTAPPSLLWFPLPSAGLCSMARRHARPACSRDDTLLRQSWVSAVKRTPLRHPAFQHKGPERAGAFLGNHRQKWQVHYAFLALMASPVNWSSASKSSGPPVL